MRSCVLVASLIVLPISAQAEELWGIAEGGGYTYFLDADTLVFSPSLPIRSATVHIVYHRPEDLGFGEAVRAISYDIDFRCDQPIFRMSSTTAYNDAMEVVGEEGPSEFIPYEPATNIAYAAEFICADVEDWPYLGTRMPGNATLEEAVERARRADSSGGI